MKRRGSPGMNSGSSQVRASTCVDEETHPRPILCPRRRTPALPKTRNSFRGNQALRISLFLLLLSLFAGHAAQAAQAAPDLAGLAPGYVATMTSHSHNPAALRGYGPVEATFYDVRQSSTGTRLSLVRFAAANHVNAETLAGKFLADLTLSPGVVSRTATASGRTYRIVQVQNGPSYAAVVSGRTAAIVSGPNAPAGTAFLAASPLFAANGLDTRPAAYPRFLDRFDRYGWGFYGMAGLESEFGWMGTIKPEGSADPVDDVAFCAKYGFIYDLWLNAGGAPEALGMRRWPEIPWKTSEANKRGLPVSAQLYGWMPYTPQYASAFETGADFLQEGWYGGSLEYKAERHDSWYSAKAADYIGRQTQEQMRPLVNNPLFLGWMEPLGETSEGGWLDAQRDYSPNAYRSWQAELRDTQRLSLADVTRMYADPAAQFTSWDQVPPLTFDAFEGWQARTVDLTGTWYCRQEAKQGEGVAASWWNDDHTAAAWAALRLPGSDHWTQFDRSSFKWCTRTFTVTADQLAARKPLYFYEFFRVENYGHTIITPLYVNGKHAGDFGPWGAIDVSSYLHPGENRIDLETTEWNGRTYLSPEAPAEFPNFSPERNRLYQIWMAWVQAGKTKFIASDLSAMRRVDPNRPIKMMAPGEGTDNWLTLASQYGAYGHFTGEGVWMYPWYKRYGYLYDVPGSSEGAGPTNDVNGANLAFERVFLEGLNSHVDVFDAQMYTRVPALLAWYKNHVAILRQLGRYDIAGPQVLLYRSDKAATVTAPNRPFPYVGGTDGREVQSSYNWDLGRGAMQALGQSSLYVSDNGIRDHKLNGYKILVDCGNPFMGAASVQGIKDWVAGGGTYVTWPFTGRGSYTQADAWPVNALTGCTVKTLRTPGTGAVTFSPGETLLPGWGGRTFADNGHCRDFVGHEYNQLSTELAPGRDCTVVARFENGAPAIVVHRIGKGRVVALGSAFFRNVEDRMGIWWSEPNEVAFWKSLLDGLGQPSVNTTDNLLIWPQRYRMNNGLDDVVIVNNFAGADKKFTLSTTLAHVPARVYRVSQNTISAVPFTLVGGKVVVRTAIPNKEVQAYLFRTHDGPDAAKHWWGYQQKMWKPALKTGGYELPKGAQPLVDPTVDLSEDWKWTQDPAASGSNAAPFNDAGWKTYPLDVMTFAGADSTKPIFMRRHFQIPADWLTNGTIRFAHTHGDGGYYLPGETGQVFINGTMVHDWSNAEYFAQDVQALLHPGDNVIAFNLRPGTTKYLGVIGTTFLIHQDSPLQTIDLSGAYEATRDGKPVQVTFPGIVNCSFPTKQTFIPADWQDKYEVVVYLRGKDRGPDGVWVNDRYYRHLQSRSRDFEIDVTPLIRFGETNAFSPAMATYVNFKQSDFDVAQIEIRLYPKSRL